MKGTTFTHTLAGKTLTATFSDLASAANGSVLVKYGETAMLATAVMKDAAPKDAAFFPLTVDYEERNYARGAILGGSYAKREGKPSEEATLTSRMIDRALRPLFAPTFRNEVQIIITVLAVEKGQDPGVIALVAASLALHTSDIPWNGPVSAVRVSQKDGVFQINGSVTAEADIDIVVAGKEGKILMLDGEAAQASEGAILEATQKALDEIALLEAFQVKIAEELGKSKRKIPEYLLSGALTELFTKELSPKIAEIGGDSRSTGKMSAELLASWLSFAGATDKTAPKAVLEYYFDSHVREMLDARAFNIEKRIDGRAFDQIRPLFAQTGGISEVLHGSGLFYRGETHVASFLTLGTDKEALLIEGMEVSREKHFIHHYNFPPFSAGETGRVGSPNRRAIGHGALAEKALRQILPSRSSFPHTIRLVSEVFSSNGSSSMASVCAGTLALKNGKVPITAEAAGISIGLLYKKPSEYKLLTDIAGVEDHFGDMDFKVAGTQKGVTAIQLDVKIDGISLEIAKEALKAAKVARLQILEIMGNA